MQNHTRLFSLTALSLAAQAVLTAQVPNLSGTWLVQPDKSELGSIPAPAIRKEVIEHREPEIRITRTVLGPGGETTTTLLYAVDGRAHNNKAGPNELTSVLKWEDAVLVIRSTVITTQGAVAITDRVSLSSDAKTMTLTRLFSMGGQDAMQTMVFAKQESATNPLAFLEPLFGEWAPVLPDSVLRQLPQLRDRVVHSYEWTVGRNSIRVREGYPRGKPQESELDGQIYWDPSTQRVLFVAVAGHSDSAGRLFLGEYVGLSDGRIQRVYDVLYRTKADTPGDELGGTRRRYREIYTIAPGGVTEATLEWWRDGRWAPFARGQYAFKRILP